jgi:hypothetical protein
MYRWWKTFAAMVSARRASLNSASGVRSSTAVGAAGGVSGSSFLRGRFLGLSTRPRCAGELAKLVAGGGRFAGVVRGDVAGDADVFGDGGEVADVGEGGAGVPAGVVEERGGEPFDVASVVEVSGDAGEGECLASAGGESGVVGVDDEVGHSAFPLGAVLRGSAGALPELGGAFHADVRPPLRFEEVADGGAASNASSGDMPGRAAATGSRRGVFPTDPVGIARATGSSGTDRIASASSRHS